ncbi:YedE family putative selenium transporter [Pseudoflavonifractor phocaeensis]|uniref:YedE family putative selenium transporter n=1 Tax=Pseudoflavonifractor phocaeensis TaxID=1870988 RepID=UPI00195B6326|nr:YedE-related selenium metabolism membrane protein [Pseudoflavonifractor phocaeensis]
MTRWKEHLPVILAGLVVGIASVVLVALGNPVNMGFCIACFLRDIAGGLGLHRAPIVQYIRPEIIGLVLGAMIMALAGKEFKVRGGSSPMTRFVLGFCVMVGALMFLGCPLRMVIRLGGGDGNAILGLVGFIAGIFAGTLFLKKGFSLKKSQPQARVEGLLMPAVNVALLVLVIAAPAFIFFSTEGPGSMRAPIAAALAAGLAVGAIAQRTRLCMAGGIRDAIMLRDFHLLMGFVAIFVAVLVGNLIVGAMSIRGGFTPGFAGQAVAHTDGLWNFLGMVLVGLGSVLLGGCPLRQLILSGGGNSDSSIAVLGMVVGAAFCHNFGLASSTDGPSFAGKVAVILGLAVVCAIGGANVKKV